MLLGIRLGEGYTCQFPDFLLRAHSASGHGSESNAD